MLVSGGPLVVNGSPFYHLHFSATKRENQHYTLNYPCGGLKEPTVLQSDAALSSRNSSSLWCGPTPCSSDRRRCKSLLFPNTATQWPVFFVNCPPLHVWFCLIGIDRYYSNLARNLCSHFSNSTQNFYDVKSNLILIQMITM